jgi:hypothetical protein
MTKSTNAVFTICPFPAEPGTAHAATLDALRDRLRERNGEKHDARVAAAVADGFTLIFYTFDGDKGGGNSGWTAAPPDATEVELARNLSGLLQTRIEKARVTWLAADAKVMVELSADASHPGAPKLWAAVKLMCAAETLPPHETVH